VVVVVFFSVVVVFDERRESSEKNGNVGRGFCRRFVREQFLDLSKQKEISRLSQ